MIVTIPLLILSGSLSASAAICPTPAFSCPDDDKCSFVTNGNTFEISCATELPGNDLVVTQTSTIRVCLKHCSLTEGCFAIVYTGGNCYMKHSIGEAVPNPNLIAARVVAQEPQSTSIPSPQQLCPPKFTCPENNGCGYRSSSRGRMFTLSCGTDFYGEDLDLLQTDGLESCAQACAANSTCAAASFVGGNSSGFCYLKTRISGRVVNERSDCLYLDSRITPPLPKTVQAVYDRSFESGQQPYILDWQGNSRDTDSPWRISTGGGIDPYNSSAVGVDTSSSHNGVYSFMAKGSDDWTAGVVQTMAVIPGKTYMLEVWAKQATAKKCFVQAVWSNWANEVLRFTPTTSWTQANTSVMVGDQSSGYIGVVLNCKKTSIEDKGWLDDITMTANL